eukprot:scpid83522/ scgid12733/ 
MDSGKHGGRGAGGRSGGRRLLFCLLVIWTVCHSAMVTAQTTSKGSKGDKGDCMYALLKQAGVRSAYLDKYVAAFRKNGIKGSALFGLNFLDLVKLLQGKSFGITHAGDIFSIHSCVSGLGKCVVKPFCQNSGTCVYSDIKRMHVCKCTTDYQGSTCGTRVLDRVTKIERTLLKLSHVVSRVSVTYTRWGKNKCDRSTGAELLYNGAMAGSYYSQNGGGANHLCMPYDPAQVDSNAPRTHGYSPIYGVEIDDSWKNNQNPTCSVCHVKGRSSQVMMPARTSCPAAWTLEYSGYVMSSHYSHRKTDFVCMDKQLDGVRGASGNKPEGVLYLASITCGTSMDCPPYSTTKAVPCVVCTR